MDLRHILSSCSVRCKCWRAKYKPRTVKLARCGLRWLKHRGRWSSVSKSTRLGPVRLSTSSKRKKLSCRIHLGRPWSNWFKSKPLRSANCKVNSRMLPHWWSKSIGIWTSASKRSPSCTISGQQGLRTSSWSSSCRKKLFRKRLRLRRLLRTWSSTSWSWSTGSRATTRCLERSQVWVWSSHTRSLRSRRRCSRPRMHAKCRKRWQSDT